MLPHPLLQNRDCLNWARYARLSHGVPLVSEFVLHPRRFVELLGSHRNYFPLFSNTQALQVVKTDADLFVDMLGLKSCGVHMVVRPVMIKENFMLLILFWQAADISRLL